MWKISVLLAVPVLVLLGMGTPAYSQNDEFPSFGKIEGMSSVIPIREAVDFLCEKEGSEYLENYSKGEYWQCIVAVLDILVAKDDYYKARGPLGRYFTEHSGHPWSYWLPYVEIGGAASGMDFSRLFVPDMVQLLGDIYRYFLPVLEPGKTDYFLGIKDDGPGK